MRNKVGNLILSLFAAVSVFLILLITSFYLPKTWDEVEFGSRVCACQILRLHCPVFPGSKTKPPGTEPSKTELPQEGHPYFPIISGAIGKIISHHFLPEKESMRFGSILFFSFAAGLCFWRLRKDFNTETAIFGVSAMLLIPRLFAHCHIAAWDSPLTSAWLISWALFPEALKSKRCAVLYGIAIGITVASKFTGCGVLLPPFIFIVYQFWRYGTTKAELLSATVKIIITTLSAYITFIAVNPPYWLHPFSGTANYLYLNTHRSDNGWNIGILFFGNVYDLYNPLPWWNTLAWTAITVPSGLLLLFVLGTGFGFYIKDKHQHLSCVFLFLNFLPLIIIRALPGVPVHDGCRMFITAFAFHGLLAGIGAAFLWQWNKQRFIYRCAVVLIYLSALFNMFWYAPQWLSYYNIFIGGLPGAAKAGMEPTYWWDAYDNEAVDWLNSHTTKDDLVFFSIGAPKNPRLSAETRYIEGEQTLEDLRCLGAKYFVFHCRPDDKFEKSRKITEERKPVFVKYIRSGGIGPWNLGTVPILEIYETDNVEVIQYNHKTDESRY